MEEKKLTDEEIIKSLECCSKNNPDCDNCPCAVGGGSLCRLPEQQALDLIHRLKGENERLTEENAILKGNPPMTVGRSNGKTIRAKLLAFDKMKEQNAELQKQVDELTDKLGKVLGGIKADELLIAKGVEQAVKDTAKEIFYGNL